MSEKISYPFQDSKKEIAVYQWLVVGMIVGILSPFLGIWVIAVSPFVSVPFGMWVARKMAQIDARHR